MYDIMCCLVPSLMYTPMGSEAADNSDSVFSKSKKLILHFYFHESSTISEIVHFKFTWAPKVAVVILYDEGIAICVTLTM